MVLAVDDGFAALLALHPMASKAACRIIVKPGLHLALGAADFLPVLVALQLGNAVAVVIQGGELPERIVLIGQLLAAGQHAADAVAQGIIAVFQGGLILGFGLQLAVGGVGKGQGALAVAGAFQAAVGIVSEYGVVTIGGMFVQQAAHWIPFEAGGVGCKRVVIVQAFDVPPFNMSCKLPQWVVLVLLHAAIKADLFYQALTGVVFQLVVFAVLVGQPDQVAFAIVVVVQAVAGGINTAFNLSQAVVFKARGTA